jgi:uncharacterized OB-fold protein
MNPTRQPSIHDAFFWDGVATGKLVVQRCDDCATLRHPPAPMCGHCGSLRWAVAETGGRGHIVSWISSAHPNRPADEPRIVILVELEEGPRLVSNLVDAPDAGPYDDRTVVVEFREDSGTMMPYFRLSE